MKKEQCPWKHLHENEGRLTVFNDNEIYRVWCSECEAEGPIASNTKEAIELWNSRSFELESLRKENYELRSQNKMLRDVLSNVPMIWSDPP